MERAQIVERLRRFFFDEMGFDASEIGDDEPIFGNHLDSIEIVKLIMFIEEEFSVKLPPYDVNLESFATVNQIAAVVHTAMAAQS